MFLQSFLNSVRVDIFQGGYFCQTKKHIEASTETLSPPLPGINPVCLCAHTTRRKAVLLLVMTQTFMSCRLLILDLEHILWCLLILTVHHLTTHNTTLTQVSCPYQWATHTYTLTVKACLMDPFSSWKLLSRKTTTTSSSFSRSDRKLANHERFAL